MIPGLDGVIAMPPCAGRCPKGDDVPDLHLGRVDQHAVDQQLDQFPPPGEQGAVQARRDRRPERVELGRQRGDLRAVFLAHGQLLLLLRHVAQPRVQRLHAGLELLEGDRPHRIGVDEPLALPLQRGPPLPQVMPPRPSRIVAQPARLRPPHRLAEDRRVGEHLVG